MVLKKYKNVMQDGIMDCGVCSLLTIIKTYGGDVSKEYLREITHTTKDGTNAFYLLEAGQKIGFDTKALKGNILDLPNKYLPCIAHVIIDNKYKHFIVIQNINRNKGIITVSDPACGIKKYKIEDYNKISTNQYLIFIPNKPIPTLDKNHELHRELIELFIQYKNVFISIFIFSFMYTVISIVTSFNFQLIIENVVHYNSKPNLYFIVMILVFLYILKSIIDWLRSNLLNFINHKLDNTLISRAFKHIISLPYLYYKNRTTGEVIARINDLGDIKETISNLFMTIFVDFVLVVVVFVALYHINANLSMIGIIMIVLYFVVIQAFNKLLNRYIMKNHEEAAKVNSYMVESIHNVDTIKSLGLEEIICDNMNVKYNHYLNTSYKFQKIFNLENLVKDIINYIGLMIIIFVATLYVLDGKMTIGEVISYHAMVIYFLEPIKNVIQMDLLFKKTKVAMDRITELYDVKQENLVVDNKFCGEKLQGNIEIKNLNYSYYGRKNILNDINLKINSGNKVIVYGKSGVGKSTIGKILMKFLDVERDKVFIDNKDINDYNALDIRREICYVGQNENIFSDTIYNNVTMNREIQYDLFLKIAVLTKVDDVIKKRNGSYEMILEENGFNISGGEKERIILARALLKNSSIYILDESLSQVDVQREREILVNLFDYYHDKTIIYISHRFNNMDLFDQKVDMEAFSNA